jgi:hypothetical protein
MEINISSESALAPQQLIDRHLGALPLDIPQGHVHAAHGIEQDRAIPPIRTDIRRLPDVLNLIRIPAHKKRLQILFNRRLDSVGTLGKCRAA